MSALQDILDKMYVEEELLAQLDEEQKHILFIKMREEQIRRWRIREAELEKRERAEVSKPRGGRRIQWLTGQDGNVWVWVMGDYPGDKSIEDIIESEARQKARALVEAELMEGKTTDEPVEASDTDEEQLKQQLRQMRLGTSSEESKETSPQSSVKNDQPQPVEVYNPKSVANFINPVPYYAQVLPSSDNARLFDGSEGSSFDSNGQNSFDEFENNAENNKKPLIQKLFGKNSIFNDQRNSPEVNKPSPVPWRVSTNRRSESPAKPIKNNSQPVGGRLNDANGNSKLESSAVGTSSQLTPSRLDNNAFLVRSYDSKSPSQSSTVTNGNPESKAAIEPHVQRNLNNTTIRSPPLVPERPPHLAKKVKDKGFVQAVRSYVPGISPTTTYSNKNGLSPFPISEESAETAENNVNMRERLKQAHNRLEQLIPQDEIQKRQSKILEELMDEHYRLKAEAEQEAESERLAYEERERKAREAESQIRFIAQRAREQHQNGLRTSSALLPMLNNPSSMSFRDAVKNITRPPKPKDRNAIIKWYQQVELPLGTGLDPTTGEPAVYFHGILSRQEADALLANQPAGAFLVRVSERIFGYTISFAVGNELGSSKHFLVEKISEGYQFLGTNQIVHKSLSNLVEYHETKPITSKGREMLLYPIGQQNSSLQPDYAELFDSQSAIYRHARE